MEKSYTVLPGIKKVSLDDILKFVCDYFGLELISVTSKRRDRELALCRFIVMYLSKKHTHLNLKNIGVKLGKRDHTTVINGISTLKGWMETDDKLRITINHIEAELF